MYGGFPLAATGEDGPAPASKQPGDGGSAGGGGGGGGGADGSGTSRVITAPVKRPPRFRDLGVAIGDAVDVQPAAAVTFPLKLSLTFDPQEPRVKGVPPELIQAFYYDDANGRWSSDGLRLQRVDISEGRVEFETTHLTIFRLGVPASNVPRIHQLEPWQAAGGSRLSVSGRDFSGPAAQNVLTLGGTYVTLALDAAGRPQPLDLQDGGETLVLQDGSGQELNRVELGASPESHSSWTRATDGDRAASFVEHGSVSGGRLFSPGTRTDGTSFTSVAGAAPRAPQPGDLVVNEALLAPPDSYLGDANGDGETISREDEFVELVNTTDHPLELGGCRLLTRAGERHRMPEGTILPGGLSLLIFGVDDPAHSPQPAGPFGGETFLPDTGTPLRLVTRLPEASHVGTTFLTGTTFRRTSNPVTVQVLSRNIGRTAAFIDATSQFPDLSQHEARLLRAGDIDRDGDIDLVAVDGTMGLLVLLNDGFGRFVAQTPPVLPSGLNMFFDLALVDVTGDGAPEILIGDTNASGSSTQLVVLANNGGGHFRVLSQTGALNGPGAVGPAALTLSDTDGDGDLDVIIGLIGDSPFVFENDGSGAFSHRSGADTIRQEAVVSPRRLISLDVDGDGDLDVLLGAEIAGLGGSPALQLFVNNGTGFEDATTRLLPINRDGAEAVASGDLDGDGDIDVIAGSPTGPVHIYLNDGTGTFAEAADRLTAREARALAVADVDGDGDLDLIVAKPPRDEGYVNDGTGHFSALAPLPTVSGAHEEILAVDVDNDGDVDLLGLGSDPTLLLNTVTRVNHPPTLDPISDQTVTEGDRLTFDVRAADTDGDVPALTASLRSGASVASLGALFSDHGDGHGTFDWTPDATQGARPGRVQEVVFRASDGIGSAEATARITVNDFNRPPTLAPVAPLTSDELVPIAIQLNASDPDTGDLLSYGAAGLPSGATLNSTTGAFAWTPGPQQGDGPSGSRDYPITFTVTDLGQATASQTTTLTIVHRNHAPTFTSIPAQQIMEGQALALTLGVTDVDGDPLTVSAPTLPPGATFDSALRRFAWTPDLTQARPAPYAARFEATDGSLTATLDVDITVTEFNRPPEFVDLTDQTVDEGQLLQFTVNVTDADADPIGVSIVGTLPAGATYDDTTRRFQWTPDSTQAGDYTVTFRVSDGRAMTDRSITIRVVDVNRSPLLTPVSDQRVREGELLQVAIQASDPDGGTLSVTVSPLPRGAQVRRQGGPYIFQWVPGMDQAGTYDVEVRVSDGAIDVTDPFTITVEDNPALQPLVAQIGMAPDGQPEATPLGSFGEINPVLPGAPLSLGLDLSSIHPAHVSQLELFATQSVASLAEADVQLYVSSDNILYHAYDGPKVFTNLGRQIVLANLDIPDRYIKIHLPNGSWPNYLSEAVQAFGAIPQDTATTAFLDDLGERTFRYFSENVNTNGLIPDRVGLSNGSPVPGTVYSTAATGFWLAALPIAVERGWITRTQGETFARQTLEFFLGITGGPAQGQFGFFYHFLNGDGTRFTGFGDDGVSSIDSSLLFLGALSCGEYFGGSIQTLGQQLYDNADWEAFFDHGGNQAVLTHGENMLRMVWTPERGFERHLDYVSEGLLAYVLAAGSATHPIQPDPNLASGPESYYTFSRGNFGRVLGRYGRDGRPFLQSFFGSLFTYLYPSLFVDLNGLRDRFNMSWSENTRSAILANFQFALDNSATGYNRLFWGISASDGPTGYEGLYGALPLDPGAGPPRHDGTIAPYALAGSLPFAADLALPALQDIAQLQGGRLLDRYGLRSGVNVRQDFFDPEYLGIDQGALLLGLEQYRTDLVGGLVRRSGVVQRALAQLQIASVATYALESSGPHSAHAYMIVDSGAHLTQTIEVPHPALTAPPGDLLLELHPYGIDTALDYAYVDVEVSVNGQFLRTVRFTDRRGDGVVDVGSVYVPISQALVAQPTNTITLTWVGGERWVQLEDVELSGPTGRQGTQESWRIGQRDGAYQDFGEERLTDDSYLVGDPIATFERALNVVDEPRTDVLFELSDVGVDRLLRLAAVDTDRGLPVTVEVMVNNATVGTATLTPGSETTVDINQLVLHTGWNHLVLRHAMVPGDGQYVLWDSVALERQTGSDALTTIIRTVVGDQLVSSLSFGFAPPAGALLNALQYIEVNYQLDASFERITISTDNRNGPVHRFTGPTTESAAGLVGEIDSTVVAPLLWQVYDDHLAGTVPPFTDTVEWAYVPDKSEPGFDATAAIDYRTLVNRTTLGERPTSGRSAASPVFVYLVADFRGKPGQGYGTDRLLIERFEQ